MRRTGQGGMGPRRGTGGLEARRWGEAMLKFFAGFVAMLVGPWMILSAGDLWAASGDQDQTTEPLTVPSRAIAAASDPKQEVGRIADHIKDNYARLHTLSVLLQTTSLDRSVTKREEVTTHP